MPTKAASKHIPLKTLLEIQANSYRSKDGKTEYCKFEIDDQIFLKQSLEDLKRERKLIKDYNKAV